MAAPKSESVTPVKAPSKRAEAGKRNVSGVWMVYVHWVPDDSSKSPRAVVVSPHADELEARRAAMDGAADSRVVFVPWGQTVTEALAK